MFVTIVADLRKLDSPAFWNMMDYHGWTHPFDDKGRRRDYADLPETIKGMKDDPYRSLAGELRNIGGFAKDSTPYSEFVWADFLRLRIKPKAIEEGFPSGAAERARRWPSRRRRAICPAGARRTQSRRREARRERQEGRSRTGGDRVAVQA